MARLTATQQRNLEELLQDDYQRLYEQVRQGVQAESEADTEAAKAAWIAAHPDYEKAMKALKRAIDAFTKKADAINTEYGEAVVQTYSPCHLAQPQELREVIHAAQNNARFDAAKRYEALSNLYHAGMRRIKLATLDEVGEKFLKALLPETTDAITADFDAEKWLDESLAALTPQEGS